MDYTHYEIATRAYQLRDNLGVRKGIENIFRLLEEHGFKIFRYPLGLDSILGCSARYGKDKVIVTNSSTILSREIFTAAHELGHHELHLTESSQAIVDREGDEKDDIEKDADYFAACFLMPKHVLERYIDEDLARADVSKFQGIDIAMIQSTFNVSFDAAVNRLLAIGAIDQEGFKELNQAKAETSARAFVRAVKGNEALMEASNVKYLPAEFLKMILHNYEEKLVPLDNLKKIFEAFDIPLVVGEEEEALDSNEVGGIKDQIVKRKQLEKSIRELDANIKKIDRVMKS